MWWPFKKEKKENKEEILKGLLKAQEILNQRFAMKQMDNETYLKKSEELRKKNRKISK